MAAVALGVALILPPTELKSSWSSVRYATPERAYAAPVAVESPPVTYPASASVEPEMREWPVSVERQADSRDAGYAEEMRVADDDRAYGDGYTWASDREIEDPRACRRFRGPRAEGCRDYVASLGPADAEEPDEPEQVASRW